MSSQITSYDFTAPKDLFTLNQLMATLNEWCKKYVFQLEKGDSGYEHWQGRVSLIKKRRKGELISLGFLPKAHLSPTSNNVHQSNQFNYVMKADSRIDGPWSEKDYEEPPVLTRQLRLFMKYSLRPWQENVLQLISEPDDRFITLIYDRIGNAGKSVFSEWLEYHKHAYEIPPMRSMEDIMQCCMCIKSQKCYIVDMPRAMKKDKLADFYSGLECLKNGQVYDKRYSFKKRRFDRPQVLVFTNVLPQWSFMSIDRWRVFEMQADYTLKKMPIVKS